ncbi:hypothetical protein BP6252_05893 [Coleophoma cylindrospora]|uniref:Xylanolytic transcriptional activator regulatory domain-containing protein n=1 Tax=Coleophoma cylindrospora TaxID=1849047 RepID=A0A3D8RV71_9HELO|nr:hypothetical protein BP6252_05893 [Coleophoma cylindrospora]
MTVSLFPMAFFIDTDIFRSVSHSALNVSCPVPAQVSALLGLDSAAVCEPYFSSIDTWFPFISRKRLNQGIRANASTETAGLALLLLCMKLVTDTPLVSSAAESQLYREARSYLNTIEEVSPMSLYMLQSLVLVALFEMGHGIFPAAYLTVGRATRIAVLSGVHDRKTATQLFQMPQTWTYWEEERRTWWAISILERCLNIGPTGLPLATPEPTQDDLLPTADSDWLQGGIGTNAALYTTSFSPGLEIAPFARVCQVAHILGRVINHRNCRKDIQRREFVLDEALQLNATLNALDEHVSGPMGESRLESDPTANTVEVALCTAARLTLYHMYSCNNPDILSERLAEESAMQTSCLEGLKQIIATRAAVLARRVIQQGTENINRSSPLVVQCLYDVATECQWFIREGNIVDGAGRTMQLLMEALTLLGRRWGIADKCLKLLTLDSE